MEEEATNSSSNGSASVYVGIFYVAYASSGITLHLLEIGACFKLSYAFNGFRFIAHHSAADMLLLFAYGIWGGAVVLANNEITTPEQRTAVNVILNFPWWSSSYLSILVTLTRLLGIVIPLTFRNMSMLTSHLICVCVWLIAFMQSYAVTFFPWYSGLYFNANGYGMTADWVAYALNGTQIYYFVFNGFTIFSNLLLYIAVLVALIHKTGKNLRNKTLLQQNLSSTVKRTIIDLRRANVIARKNANIENWNRSVEFGLLISCFINWFVAILAQVFMNWLSLYAPWRDCLIMVALMTQCWASTLLRLFLSTVLRSEVRQLFIRCMRVHEPRKVQPS